MKKIIFGRKSSADVCAEIINAVDTTKMSIMCFISSALWKLSVDYTVEKGIDHLAHGLSITQTISKRLENLFFVLI